MKQYRITMPDDRGIKYESFRYPGGEVQVRLLGDLTEIQQAQELYVTAKIRNGEIMELACLTDALYSEAQSLMYSELYLPYLPYGRADRKFTPGDCFGLSVFSDMLQALNYNSIYTLDAHSRVTTLFGIRSFEVRHFIEEARRDIEKKHPKVTVIFPDSGAERYLNQGIIASHFIQAGKLRNQKTGELTGFHAPMIPTSAGLIIDDICDGGGTFIGLAKQIKAQQPHVELYLYVTHGIFSKGIDELQEYFKTIYTPNPLAVNPYLCYGDFVHVLGGKDGL